MMFFKVLLASMCVAVVSSDSIPQAIEKQTKEVVWNHALPECMSLVNALSSALQGERVVLHKNSVSCTTTTSCPDSMQESSSEMEGKLHWTKTLHDCMKLSKMISSLNTKDSVVCNHVPEGYSSVVYEKNYTLVEEKKTFDDAIVDCARRGMRLATIMNEKEQIKVAEEAKKSGSHIVWLGGSDRKTTGDYVWESTGRAVTYSSWDNWEPDHGVYNMGETQHCIGVLVGNGRWHDLVCSMPLPFICESVP